MMKVETKLMIKFRYFYLTQVLTPEYNQTKIIVLMCSYHFCCIDSATWSNTADYTIPLNLFKWTMFANERLNRIIKVWYEMKNLSRQILFMTSFVIKCYFSFCLFFVCKFQYFLLFFLFQVLLLSFFFLTLLKYFSIHKK